MKINKSHNLLLLFFLSFVTSGSSQSAEVPMSEYQKLRNEFEQEEVTPAQLAAFELRGGQKLNDLANYLEYISDQSMNKTFRLQAKQLALELFVAPNVSFKYYQDGKTMASTIENYLEYLLKQKGGKAHFEFLNISKINEIEKTADGSYFWMVQYEEKQSKEDQTTSRVFITLKVSLLKIEKEFGSKTKFIWEVLLGEMLDLEVGP